MRVDSLFLVFVFMLFDYDCMLLKIRVGDKVFVSVSNVCVWFLLFIWLLNDSKVVDCIARYQSGFRYEQMYVKFKDHAFR